MYLYRNIMREIPCSKCFSSCIAKYRKDEVMQISNQLSDKAILEELAQRLVRCRVALNKTQEEVAESSGMGKLAIRNHGTGVMESDHACRGETLGQQDRCSCFK